MVIVRIICLRVCVYALTLLKHSFDKYIIIIAF